MIPAIPQHPIRERGPRCGAEPWGDDPASAALDDLPATAHPDRVIARYAVLRAVLMGDGTDAHLVSHARSAARAHLDAVMSGWDEAAYLRPLLDGHSAGSGRALGRAFGRAARAAESAGDHHGAALLRRLAHMDVGATPI